ncbi:hypothetical protein ACLBYC_10610 [Methylobacterium brachiatum]
MIAVALDGASAWIATGSTGVGWNGVPCARDRPAAPSARGAAIAATTQVRAGIVLAVLAGAGSRISRAVPSIVLWSVI